MLRASCLGLKRPFATRHTLLLCHPIASLRMPATITPAVALHPHPDAESLFSQTLEVDINAEHAPIHENVSDQPFPIGKSKRAHLDKAVPNRQTLSSYKDSEPSMEVPHLPDPSIRRRLLSIVHESQSASEAWEAYCALLAIPCPERQRAGKPKIPFLLMHRLSRLLMRSRPRTRTLFMRLFSVLKAIRDSGGKVHLDEWNALINCAGKGWRKTRPEDFALAVDIYNDMLMQKAPAGGEHSPEGRLLHETVKPDIVTYTTLLTIAARTLYPPALQHAISLLKSSGIAPNRITHLSLLPYFTYTKQLSGVRSTLQKMKEQGLDVGLDGLNACLWAFGYHNRVDIAYMIYRVLRHHVVKELEKGENDIDGTMEYLANTHNIVIPDNVVPNTITYITTLQILAYHGHFTLALNVFVDMLSSDALEAETPRHRSGNGPNHFSSTLPAFRALFLGFARHGKPPLPGHASFAARLRSLPGESTWTLNNLDTLFQSFLALPESFRPSRSVLYWIMVAFGKTSGNDITKLRQVWLQLEERFPAPWAGPGHRLKQLKERIFSSRATRGSR